MSSLPTPPSQCTPLVRTFRGKKPIYFPFLLWIFILQCIFPNILQKLHLGDPRWVLSLSRTLKQIIILKSKWLLWELCRETRICFNPQRSNASIAEVNSTSRNHSELGECAWCFLPKNGRLRRSVFWFIACISPVRKQTTASMISWVTHIKICGISWEWWVA